MSSGPSEHAMNILRKRKFTYNLLRHNTLRQEMKEVNDISQLTNVYGTNHPQISVSMKIVFVFVLVFVYLLYLCTLVCVCEIPKRLLRTFVLLLIPGIYRHLGELELYLFSFTIMVSTISRLAWIDWMKTIAIFFIIAGHLWVPGNKYIYVFSVPCFFIISGFLTKRESDTKVFLKKLWWNLVVPMVLMLLINTAVQFAVQIAKDTFDVSYLWKAPLLSLVGMQGQNYAAGGLKAMWFVYTLAVCKILSQIIPPRGEKLILVTLSIVCMLGSKLLHEKGILLYNAFVDVLLAMPFFVIGTFFRPLRKRLNELSQSNAIVLFALGILGVYFCGTYNDIVMLYRCEYGSSLLLCLLGAICGTMAVYAVSTLLQTLLTEFVNVIGGGDVDYIRTSLCYNSNCCTIY